MRCIVPRRFFLPAKAVSVSQQRRQLIELLFFDDPEACASSFSSLSSSFISEALPSSSASDSSSSSTCAGVAGSLPFAFSDFASGLDVLFAVWKKSNSAGRAFEDEAVALEDEDCAARGYQPIAHEGFSRDLLR